MRGLDQSPRGEMGTKGTGGKKRTPDRARGKVYPTFAPGKAICGTVGSSLPKMSPCWQENAHPAYHSSGSSKDSGKEARAATSSITSSAS